MRSSISIDWADINPSPSANTLSWKSKVILGRTMRVARDVESPAYAGRLLPHGIGVWNTLLYLDSQMDEHTGRFAGIEQFVATSRLGSFSAAACSLDMTPSGVAKAVTRLEVRLGLKLFHRTTRKLTLTPEGAAYYATCLRILDHLETSENDLAPKARAPQGRVRVELPAAFGRRHILKPLLELASGFSKLDLSISFSERTVDFIQSGADVGVRIGRLNSDPNLVSFRLGAQRLVICAAPAYLDKHGPIRSLEDLMSRDCIAGFRPHHRAIWLFRNRNGEELPIEVKIRHEFSDGDAMLEAVLQGCGVMQIPTWLAEDSIKKGMLIPQLTEFAGGEMPIHAIWPASRYLKPKARAVIDCLKNIAAKPDSGFHL